jgi:hypothetical protein
MTDVYSQIAEQRLAAKKFVEQGGDEALFWAGRMSLLISEMERSHLQEIGNNFQLLIFLKEEYDDCITSRL